MTAQEATKLYPDPKITVWYRTRFPKRGFNAFQLFVFLLGFATTIIGSKSANKRPWRTITAIATILFVVVLVPAAVVHLVAWTAMRKTEKKRAKAMGISLQEYWNL